MKTKSLTAIVIVATAIAVPPQARADSALELVSGSTTQIIDGTAGYASFDGAFGGWDINVNTGLASPADGGVGNSVDVNSLDHTGLGTSSPLDIYWSATGYPGGLVVAGIGGTTSGASVSFNTYYGSSLLSTTTLLTASPTYTGPAFSGSEYGSIPEGGPYALTEEVVVGSGAPEGTLSFDANVAVPDGGSTMILLGGALVALTVVRSKNRTLN